MKISVIIPIYNVSKYLQECFESIEKQELKDYELLTVDDGSYDSSAQMCDEAALKDERTIVYHTMNHGQATARNMAVNGSLGDFVSFVDSDDIIHPQMLSMLCDSIQKDETLISMCSPACGITVPKEFDREYEYAFHPCTTDELFFNELIQSDFYTQGIKLDAIWGKLINKRILIEFPFTDGRIFEDTAVICKWFDSAKMVSDTKAQLYFYRIRENSTITSKFSYKKFDQLWADEEIEAFYRKKKYKKMISYSTKAFCDHIIEFESQLADNNDIRIKTNLKHRKNKKIIQNIHTWQLSKNDFYYYSCEVFPWLPQLYVFYHKIFKR